jgi:2'-5' RNA ligase
MSNHVIIAFLPVDGSWAKIDFPHMTLCHAGITDNLNEADFNIMAKDAISASRLTGTFSLAVTGVEEFGEGVDKVDVLTLYPTPQLLLARRLVEKWDTGEFPEFKPHVTIGPIGSAAAIVESTPVYSEGYRRQALPTKIYFNRIAACWGDKRLIFNIDEMY